MTYTASEYVEFFGEEFEVHIKYNFTEGYSAGWSDPGCDDEVDVVDIYLQRVAGGRNAPKFKLTHGAYWAFRELDWIDGTCLAHQKDWADCHDPY